MDVKINVGGHADDLYTLSLLFPEGAYPDLYVVTGIRGQKDGPLDRVVDASNAVTYVTGSGCRALIEANDYGAASWVAQEIIAPLNGYAVLADSNFQPVRPVSASFEGNGTQVFMTFGPTSLERRSRLITANRDSRLIELRNRRVSFMEENALAAYAAAVVAREPSWADYYRLLEDIAGHRGTTIDKLSEAGLASPRALNAFKNAANNRAFGRHGQSKRNLDIPQGSLMNLLEAREFVRQVVASWIDLECGGRMPRDRVDGGPLRFGLDSPDG